MDPSVSHFCEAACPQCGYICHLPYGLLVQDLVIVRFTNRSLHQVILKGSMIPLTDPCRKPSGLLKSQGIRQLRPKAIGLEPKRAVPPNCVSCIATILAAMHTSISAEIILRTAKKQNRSTRVSEFFRTLASQKIGYRTDCSGLGLVGLHLRSMPF